MEQKTHKIDAKDQILGRLAVKVAVLLRGKGKPAFLRYLDAGDRVEVSNIEKIKFTGKKLKQKSYWRHSGYPGGLKEESLEKVFEKDPAKVLRQAVLGMLPKNRTRAKIIKRLIIRQGEQN
ncbi:MAG: 50S ribosomal protein L13 [Candidatus Portnoybacteria bacterium]|nr:50S ribosomal protein L13 [Candidatus Portnoybacteria bacterium]